MSLSNKNSQSSELIQLKIKLSRSRVYVETVLGVLALKFKRDFELEVSEKRPRLKPKTLPSTTRNNREISSCVLTYWDNMKGACWCVASKG